MNEAHEYPKMPNGIDSLSNKASRILMDLLPGWMIARTNDLVRESKILDYAKAGSVWCDIGTGKGFIPALLRVHGVRTVSYDPFDIPTPHTKTSLKDRFVIADASHPPIKSDSLDGASMFFVLHHAPADRHKGILREVLRTLKPGAPFILVEDQKPESPRQSLITEFNDKLLNLANAETVREHSLRSNNEWESLLSEAGFQKIEMITFSRSDVGAKISHPVFISRKPE